jgi:hypothetical protein
MTLATPLSRTLAITMTTRCFTPFPIIILFASSACCAGSQTSSDSPKWHFETDDTHLALAVIDNRQVIIELRNPANGWNWTPKPSEVPLLHRVLLATTDAYNVDWNRYPKWVYQDAVVDTSDGYMVTLRFVSSAPKLELKSFWRARKGCGPVEHWMTVQNQSGALLSWSYWDIVAANLKVTADSRVDLWRFYRQSIGKNNGGVDVTPLGANARTTSIISNTINQGDPEPFLPFEVLDCGSRHGLYIGYSWDFGKFETSTGSDAHTVTSKFHLGDVGCVKSAHGGLLTTPYMFYGTYTGDVDDGSNRMKRWFWNHRIPTSLRENDNEPLVELHCPFYDEAGWAAYLKNHPLKSWGVDLIKMDVSWMMPGDFKDWASETQYMLSWKPYPTKWPNGMTFGKLAEEHQLLASLYLPNFCDGADITTEAGKKAQTQALLDRYDNEWYHYYRTDGHINLDHSVPGHDAFLEIVDSMIASRPGFRYEHCSGGGCRKSFDLAERLTFMTIEDLARAHTYRRAYYGNSYVFNPVQLKADVAVDWGLGPDWVDDGSAAWDKYNFRTGLMGAMMVCGGERELDNQEEAVARETWQLYQTKQRAILRGADVYHILPFPDGVSWDGIQYFNPALNRGSVLLFKPSANAPNAKVIKLKGLDENTIYTLTFQDRNDQSTKMNGAELMKHGLSVEGMTGDFATEIIWIN